MFFGDIATVQWSFNVHSVTDGGADTSTISNNASIHLEVSKTQDQKNLHSCDETTSADQRTDWDLALSGRANGVNEPFELFAVERNGS